MAAKKVPTLAQYLGADATYKATQAALAKQLSTYKNDITAQRNNYQQDYSQSLKDLGYTPGVAATAAVKNKAGKVTKAAVAAKPGVWNYQDNLTASGRAMQNLLNDYAARGMLQSSGYAQGQNDLTRSLNDQLTGITKARTTFNNDLTRQQTAYTDQNTAARQQAAAEAAARRSAKYGLV